MLLISTRSFELRVMNCSTQHYLNRTPEHLVLEGYRAGLLACSLGHDAPFQCARDLFLKTVGTGEYKALMPTFLEFISALGRCSICRLGFFPAGTSHLCRDEALVLALIAGVQHGDEDAQCAASEALSCRFRAQMLVQSAGSFGLVLRACGQTLLPVPVDVIGNIVIRAALSERTLETHLN